MRVNIYAEEQTDRVEIISKEIDGATFTGCRFYLELPVTLPGRIVSTNNGIERSEALKPAFGEHTNIAGPFMHREGDDDSSAVTFWGKQDLRTVLLKALALLDAHYGEVYRRELIETHDTPAGMQLSGAYLKVPR